MTPDQTIRNENDIPTEKMKELPEPIRRKNEAPPADPSQAEAEAIIARLELPRDLHERWINLVAFNSDEDCNYFYPGRSRAQHEFICGAVRARLTPRSAQFSRTFITPEMLGDVSLHPGGPPHYADSYNFLAPTADEVKGRLLETPGDAGSENVV